MPAHSESTTQGQDLLASHVLTLDDVLKMGKTMSSAMSRSDEHLKRLDATVNEIKAEQVIIKENLRNMERTLETMVNALREQKRDDPEASGSRGHAVVTSLEQPEKPDPDMGIKRKDTSGRATKYKIEDDAQDVTSALIGTSSGAQKRLEPLRHLFISLPIQTIQDQLPELPNPDPGMDLDIEQTDISGQGEKRKFEEDTPEINTSSTETSSGTQKRPSQSLPPIQTISEAAREIEETKINAGGRENAQDDNDSEEEKEVQNITERNTGHWEDDEDEPADERDELASDDDSSVADEDDEDVEERMLNLKAVLVFKNDKRCTACINKGLEECKVFKTPYLKLGKYADSVSKGTAKPWRRPSSSVCFACRKRHAKFCHLPITREKLGPGFTEAHHSGPFPVPASAPVKPKEESTSRVLRPRKKARTFSPESPLSSNPVV